MGHKMSKSLGNVLPPQQVINDKGADVLRLWVAATDYSSEMTVSDEILKRTGDSYRRIRNTARFFLSNLDDFDPSEDLVNFDDMLELDLWALNLTISLHKEILMAYDSYQLHHIYQKLHNFCVTDMGGFYLNIIKDRQYTCQKNSIARRSAQTAIYYILEYFVRWISPILSFTADEIWGFMPGDKEESVFFTEWLELSNISDTKIKDQEWKIIIEIRNTVNKILEDKKAEGIQKSLEAEITIYAEKSLLDILGKLENELRFVFITSEANIKPISDLVDKDDIISTEMEGLKVKVTKTDYIKCQRCWHHVENIGSNKDHPNICNRCLQNVEGEGEMRLYA
jgi:isoleucyl-tRNA synthetase